MEKVCTSMFLEHCLKPGLLMVMVDLPGQVSLHDLKLAHPLPLKSLY